MHVLNASAAVVCASPETQRDVFQRVQDELEHAGLPEIHTSFYLTSIYDHSIFEAFSKVVQKLIKQYGVLESLLNGFISVRTRESAGLRARLCRREPFCCSLRPVAARGGVLITACVQPTCAPARNRARGSKSRSCSML